jgi:GrpB-like predicted nucleotidyltransferase (UPF0157 family)
MKREVSARHLPRPESVDRSGASHDPIRQTLRSSCCLARENAGVAPEDVERFGRDVAAHLEALLGADLVGAYFVGSIALGGYVPGESDVDIIAVCEHGLSQDAKRWLANDLLDLVVTCPARGLEFSLYRREVAAAPPKDADFEVNVNGGPKMATSIELHAREEPGFWYVLDRATAHRCGVPISGPPACAIFADASRQTLLAAMVASIRWHRQHERATLNAVLNASRAWRYGVEGVVGSKLDGAAWARQRWRRPGLIDAAVELRHGRSAHLEETEVNEYLAQVENTLAKQLTQCSR